MTGRNDNELKALTIWQPWATLIALGAKRIETRHWRTWHRGLLAIHAAKRWTRAEREISTVWPFADYLSPHVQQQGPLPLGSIVAIAQVDMCVSTDVINFDERYPPHERDFGNYRPGRYGWVLTDVVAFHKPVICPGEQGLWTVPDAVLPEVREQYRIGIRRDTPNVEVPA